MKFDLIIANPPFQKPRVKGKGNDFGSKNTIWNLFVLEAFKLCKENGFVSMITPSGWRRPNNEKSEHFKICFLMKSKQILYLSMYDKKDGQQYFNALTRFDVWLVKNCNPYKPTIINDEKHERFKLDISRMPFIPNYDILNILKLFSSEPNRNYEVICNSSYHSISPYLSNKKDNTYCYPLIHAIHKDKIRFLWSSRNDKGMFGIPKVIIGSADFFNDVVIDLEGQYGMSESCIAIKVSSQEEAEALRKGILSLNKLLPALKWSQFLIDWKLFTYLKREFWNEHM